MVWALAPARGPGRGQEVRMSRRRLLAAAALLAVAVPVAWVSTPEARARWAFRRHLAAASPGWHSAKLEYDGDGDGFSVEAARAINGAEYEFFWSPRCSPDEWVGVYRAGAMGPRGEPRAM